MMLELLRSDGNILGELFAVAVVVGPAVLGAWGMRRGYLRRRAGEEAAVGPLPATPEPARAPDGEALYTGTTHGGSRARRLAAHGLFGRGPCRYWLEPGQLVFQRFRGPVVGVRDVHEVGRTGAHAGRVLGPGRITVVAWRLGDTDVDSGFGFDDADLAEAFAAGVTAVTSRSAERAPHVDA